MRIDFAKKAIMALLFILIALLVAILILMSRSGDDSNPSDTDADTTVAVTTVADTTVSDTTDPEATVTTVPVTTEASTTVPVTTVPPVTDPVTTEAPATDPVTTEAVTTTPPETDPPLVGPEAPEGFSLSKKFESETGARLNIRAVCTAVRNDNGSVSLTVDVYLIHYSIGMGARTGAKLIINDNTVKFSTEKISQTENKKTATLLFSHTETVAYGDIVDLYVKMPIRVTYGSGENAKYIEYAEIDTALQIK